MKKFWAFTLAETLIVMGVIGIVAALTLPNLNSSTGDKERVAKAKKIYQNIEDAYGRAIAIYGPISDWDPNNLGDDTITQKTGERVTEFMKLSKNCGMKANQGCFHNSIDSQTNRYKVITADGTSIAFRARDVKEIDLDGPNKGGDIYGKDLFDGIYTYRDGDGQMILSRPNNFLGYFSSPSYGFAWMVTYDNTDYLKANSDGKCKNNASITLDGVTNTTCK